MRYILIVKGSRYSEASLKTSREHRDAMAAYNELLARAGVLLAAEGLQPSSSGMRITYPVHGGMPKVTVGPFTLEKELVAGFKMIEVKSEEEAIDWAMRMPNPSGFGDGEIELRLLSEDVNLLHVSPTMALEADLRDQIDMLKKS
ncbi:YciI family protein [Paenibacillus mendelii]|uniref:YciI family protein n=1 Tax=Paenibacillus mendelii TaxID=206163 RepID=A0ABV6J4E7_9BACL|nr:YciI family protein [Paenibacillus mendelii]MCQ6561720.1 YciI family protein [Paenibacillus mendelii]